MSHVRKDVRFDRTHHLGTWDVLLWVLEVLEESLFLPSNTLVNVGGSVRETLDLT